MNDKDKKQLNSAKASNDAKAVQDKSLGEEEVQEEGRELCPKCGNIMVEDGGKKTCSSCSDEIDFFGENEEPEKKQ